MSSKQCNNATKMLPKAELFYNGGQCGMFLPVVGFEWNLAPSNDRGEFELNRAKSKNNITENSPALGHETHTSDIILFVLERR